MTKKLPKPKLRTILPWFYWAIGGTVLVALLLWLVYWSKQVSQDWATLQQTPTDATKKKFDGSLDIAKAIVGGIGSIATVGGGFFVLWNIRLTQTRLITERFSKAVEQLGSDKIEVRLGGIYALERIAYDSDRDHWTIMEVLTSFIQERSPNKPIPDDLIRTKAYEMWQKSRDSETDERRWIAAESALAKERVTKDIQAALTVIGRRHKKDPPDKRLNLSGTNLSGTNLLRANLQGADLCGANLRWARLIKANLQGGNLGDANLQWADLGDANLQRADLCGANLQWARLIKANLQGANLGDANLQRADLSEAKLQRADLSEANLQGARLKANLQGANLGDANLQGAYLIEANLQGAYLVDANLQEAGLRDANLQEADLWGANLQGAYLGDANLQGAYIGDANLQGAYIGDANLQGAYLSEANLQGAYLIKANLQGAILLGTDLRQAEELTKEQLAGKAPPLLCNVALPDGFPDIDKLKDRDCDRLPQVLHERFPEQFNKLDEAKEYVNEARQKKWG